MRRCVFCGDEIDPKAPPEHVLPKWVRRFRPPKGRFREVRAINVKGEAPRKLPVEPVKFGCPACCRRAHGVARRIASEGRQGRLAAISSSL